MRRAERLFEIIQLMRRSGLIRARDLAEKLEVSERTVYRDIQAMIAQGVPIEGEAGVGYVLREGFDLPPLMFDKCELEALMLGARIVEGLADAELSEAASNLIAKVEAVVPEPLRDYMASLPLLAPGNRIMAPISFDAAQLRYALRERYRVNFAYTDGIGAATERTVRPLHSPTSAQFGCSPPGVSSAKISACSGSIGCNTSSSRKTVFNRSAASRRTSSSPVTTRGTAARRNRRTPISSSTDASSLRRQSKVRLVALNAGRGARAKNGLTQDIREFAPLVIRQEIAEWNPLTTIRERQGHLAVFRFVSGDLHPSGREIAVSRSTARVELRECDCGAGHANGFVTIAVSVIQLEGEVDQQEIEPKKE